MRTRAPGLTGWQRSRSLRQRLFHVAMLVSGSAGNKKTVGKAHRFVVLQRKFKAG